MNAKPITPGIYPGFDIAAYHRDPCPAPSLSASIAKTVLNFSAGHAACAHPKLGAEILDDGEERGTSAQLIGDAAHKLILGRGKDLLVLDYPDWQKKDAREDRDAAIAAGKLPILQKHFDAAQVISRFFFLQLCDHEAGPLRAGESEVALFWREDNYLTSGRNEGGMWFRSLVDFISADRLLVVDIKTTSRPMPPWEVGRKLDADGWDVQAAMIDRGLNVLDPANAGRRTYRFISIEQSPPFGLVVNEISEMVMSAGRRKVQLAVETWAECLASGKWPLYSRQIQYPEVPAYAQAKWSERERAILWED